MLKKITEKEQLISELTEKLTREKEELKLLYDKQKEQRTALILGLMNDNNLKSKSNGILDKNNNVRNKNNDGIPFWSPISLRY